jgi:precorrin-6B methylase 2
MKNPKDLLTIPNPSSQDFSALMEKSTEGLKKHYLIMTAWETGLFEHTTTPKTSHNIAQELGGYHEAMIQLFCEALTEVGLLTKLNDTYTNSPMTSTYLCRNSPNYLEHTLQNMKANINRWTQLSTILKNGPITQNRQDFFGEDWLISIAEWAEAGSIASALNVVTAHLDPKRWKRLLDLGGGHGLYAIAFTALNIKLEAYVFDLPRIISVTQKYVKEYDAQRVHILPGDFYKDSIGQGYDAIFSSYNQSCTDPTLIGKMVEALAPGGDVILRRFTDASREGALKTLDWNLLSFEGKKIGSKSHSSDAIVDQKTYLKQLENAGLTILGTFPVDFMSEITFARKPSGTGSGT